MKISSTIIIKIIIHNNGTGNDWKFLYYRARNVVGAVGIAGGLCGGGMVGEPVAAAAVVVDASPSCPRRCGGPPSSADDDDGDDDDHDHVGDGVSVVSTFVRFGHASIVPFQCQYYSRAPYRVHSHSSV